MYGISRDGSKNFNIRTCEHKILGQLRMGAPQAKNAPLTSSALFSVHRAVSSVLPPLSSIHCALKVHHILLTRSALPSVLYCCITHQPAALDADLDHLN